MELPVSGAVRLSRDGRRARLNLQLTPAAAAPQEDAECEMPQKNLPEPPGQHPSAEAQAARNQYADMRTHIRMVQGVR